jgi:hypothetical protein
MAIEIVPKPKIKKRPPVNIFFYILLFVFLIFLIGYLVLYFNEKKLNRELSEIEKALQKSPAQESLEKELENWQKKINDFGLLFSRHQFTTKLFDYLEESTLPKVNYSKFKLDSGKGILELSGQTDNFETLGQQILIFKEQEFIKNFNLTDVSIAKEGKINFNIQMVLNSKIFTPLAGQK